MKKWINFFRRRNRDDGIYFLLIKNQHVKNTLSVGVCLGSESRRNLQLSETATPFSHLTRPAKRVRSDDINGFLQKLDRPQVISTPRIANRMKSPIFLGRWRKGLAFLSRPICLLFPRTVVSKRRRTFEFDNRPWQGITRPFQGLQHGQNGL